ncbi:hypothetical protein [Brevundimonas sp.]|uniref:hypothetical protein n=1 Tax=Brevundimonas sp. TaxID=1871086 RepID=UPI002899FA89|nr:hypothetical protein [Brevundimonas sp.]
MGTLILSKRDLSDHLNRAQARYELNRAIDTNNTQALTDWAKNWGEAALHEADPHNQADRPSNLLLGAVSDLERELDDAQDTLREIKDQIRALEK